MQKNVTLVAATGLVVAIAVIGTGWLFMRGSPPPRRTPAEGTPVPVQDRKRPTLELAAVQRRPEPRPVVTPGAPAPKPAEAADTCKAVEEIFREYDSIVLDPGTGVPEVDKIHTLRERSAKIDRIVERLAALGLPAIPCLSDAIRVDARVNRIDRQTVAVRAIAKIPGCRETTAALGEAFQATDAWGVKMTIVAQLAEGDCPEGLEFLCSRIDADPDFRIRGSILRFIGQKKAPCGLLVAQRLAQQDENPNVRIAAIRALSDAGDQGARLMLEDRARNDPDVSVRQNAIQAYGRIMKDAALPLLEDLLQHDPNIRIKSIAILALQELLSDPARRVLERTANDPQASEDVRARATGALAAMDRMQQGTGLPSVGAKLDAIEPVNLDRLKPLGPTDPTIGGGKR